MKENEVAVFAREIGLPTHVVEALSEEFSSLNELLVVVTPDGGWNRLIQIVQGLGGVRVQTVREGLKARGFWDIPFVPLSLLPREKQMVTTPSGEKVTITAFQDDILGIVRDSPQGITSPAIARELKRVTAAVTSALRRLAYQGLVYNDCRGRWYPILSGKAALEQAELLVHQARQALERTYAILRAQLDDRQARLLSLDAAQVASFSVEDFESLVRARSNVSAAMATLIRVAGQLQRLV